MGWFGSLFMSKTVSQLESFKTMLKDEAEIKQVEDTIALIKAKEDKQDNE